MKTVDCSLSIRDHPSQKRHSTTKQNDSAECQCVSDPGHYSVGTMEV